MSVAVAAANVAIVLMTAGAVLAFIRLAIGPDLPDRVIAFDLLSIQVLGIIGCTAVITGEPLLLDVAFILALLAFVATLAFARFMERRLREGGAHA